MAENKSFLGTGWSFPPQFSRSKRGVEMTSDEEDIRASLTILLSTEVGSRVMQPRFGCDLNRLVFEPLDTTLRAYMKDLIRTAILYFEPRVILLNVTLEPTVEDGLINITIDYRIAGTNTRDNMVFPFYTIEGVESP